MQKTLLERFLQYVQIHTASGEEAETVPTTPWQFDLAKVLEQELKELGAEQVRLSEHCYVYAALPATPGYENAPRLGFIAHMDTIPDFPGKDVHPCVHENYDGSAIVLGKSGRVMEESKFPHLPRLKGKTVITTDGTTVLGADDKAGVAEIMWLVDKLQSEQIPHGKICIAFTPDEEVGKGPDFFDVEGFGADFAYTVDGGPAGEVEYENFNASSAKVSFAGYNVHPGSAKNILVNAALVAMEFNAMLPTAQTPRDTEGYEGFFHLVYMEGSVDKATTAYILRDHNAATLAAREETMRHIAKILNEKYGEGTCTVTIKESYRNMAEKIKPCFHLIENAKKAAENVGLTPVTVPIRGGTDGARLSFMGLPCPNLGTGGYAFHGPYEHIAVEDMHSAAEMLLELVRIYSEKM